MLRVQSFGSVSRIRAAGSNIPALLMMMPISPNSVRGFVYGLPHCWLVRDIAPKGKPADFVGQSLDCRGTPGKKSHRVALLGEKPCCRLAYASTCASDQ